MGNSDEYCLRSGLGKQSVSIDSLSGELVLRHRDSETEKYSDRI